MKTSASDHQAANPTQYNIDAIAKLEAEALQGRTAIERASDLIGKPPGVSGFCLQVLLLVLWIAVNLHLVHGLQAFDPFPFGILALVVGGECVLLTTFVLISQNWMARQSERRSHLDLQVSMLAEQELTTALQMLQKFASTPGSTQERIPSKCRDSARRRTSKSWTASSSRSCRRINPFPAKGRK